MLAPTVLKESVGIDTVDDCRANDWEDVKDKWWFGRVLGQLVQWEIKSEISE